ncbi:unnamed protein product [Nezara viridula]|uniref:Odorant receptor n=1 Tax=Nezara viridula TaxID=85310 RepID=A0A9P0HSL0_NEZVI|nr:unnamed protein product [Nezara viridula]
MLSSCLVKSSLFLKMQASVKSGVYDYEGNISEEQILARAAANRDIQLSTSVFAMSCVAALVSSYFKAPLFMQQYSLPYPIWLPYKITSYWRYFPSMIFVWFIAESMVTCACSNWVAYVTMAGHLIGQFKILVIAIKEIDGLAKGEDAEIKVKARIKCCVQHHLILIKFFFDIQSYFNTSLLVAAFSTGLILCTLGYLVISPETTMAMAGSLLFVLIPELCVAGYYCVLGQKIADVTEEIGITIYSLEWYTMSLPVQRDLLMMLVGSKKTRQLTGFGLHEFSIKGLSEILQASFTYFNMLVALSGGK